MKVVFRAEVFKEGDVFVALCPELDVSSMGETVERAQTALQEAVLAFIEGCEALGTIEEVLEESGFVRKGETWAARKPVCASRLAVVR